MLKVCGVTYDHSTNYGSFLQAFALGRAIEQSRAGGGSYKYALAAVTVLPGRPEEAKKTLAPPFQHRTGAQRAPVVDSPCFRLWDGPCCIRP